MEQILRIMDMEEILDRALDALRDPSMTAGRCRALQPDIDKLEAYYTGPLWMKDFDDDCAGKLPKELKRGVLSEDAVDDLLSAFAKLRRGQSADESEYT